MYRLVSTKLIVIISLIILILTSAIIIFIGIRNQKPVFFDIIIFISVVSAILFTFLTAGLYKGVKLKDDIGDMKHKLRFRKFEVSPDAFTNPHIDASGIGELIFSLILWIFIGILISVLFWLIGGILILLFFLIAAVLYWIFFRALRLVFKKSLICRNDILKSLGYALLYTFLYTSWIYLIVFGVHYFRYGTFSINPEVLL